MATHKGHRLTLDTNVLISALIWGGALQKLADDIECGHTTLFISVDLLQEFSNVLTYPKVNKILQRRQLTARHLTSWLATYAVVVMPKPLECTVVHEDPSDDAVLACAATAGVDYIVSGDRHLLQLREFQGIPIVSPREYIKA